MPRFPILGVGDLIQEAHLPSWLKRTAIDAIKARSSHTGTQLASTISDLPETVQDLVAAMFQAGANVSLTYNDAAGTLQVTATGGDAEAMRDTIGAAIVGVGLVSVVVNDAADTISVTTTATQNAADSALRDRTTHTGVQPSSTISDLAETVRDTVASFLTPGTGISMLHDDAADTFRITNTGSGSGTSAVPRLGIVRVASSQAPADVKAQCNYVCTGTNDQVQINSALKDSSRAADGFGGLGGGCAELVGGDFFVGNNGSPITMYPATWLRGSWGSMIQPQFAAGSDRGAIELLNTAVAHVNVSDLIIGRANAGSANGHAIKFVQSGDGQTYSVRTGNDPFCIVNNVIILNVAGWGMHLSGVNSGARETQVYGVHCFGPQSGGFYIGSTDSKFANCTANAGAGPGFYTVSGASGNTKLVNCKAYYCNEEGFLLSGARGEITGCNAQDNGTWGFNVNTSDMQLTGCTADSNSRLSDGNTTGGFRLGGSGTFSNVSYFDRGQTPTSPQLRGIVIPGTAQMFLTGRGSIPTGGTHNTGTPGANSFVRVVRNGTTLWSVG